MGTTLALLMATEKQEGDLRWMGGRGGGLDAVVSDTTASEVDVSTGKMVERRNEGTVPLCMQMNCRQKKQKERLKTL